MGMQRFRLISGFTISIMMRRTSGQRMYLIWRRKSDWNLHEDLQKLNNIIGVSSDFVESNDARHEVLLRNEHNSLWQYEHFCDLRWHGSLRALPGSNWNIPLSGMRSDRFWFLRSILYRVINSQNLTEVNFFWFFIRVSPNLVQPRDTLVFPMQPFHV